MGLYGVYNQIQVRDMSKYPSGFIFYMKGE